MSKSDRERAEEYCGPGRNGKARTIWEATRILSNGEQASNLISDELHTAFLAGAAFERERGRWVSVTERLPEESGDYLVVYEWGGMSKIEWSKKHGQWNNSDLIERDDVNAMRDITHWMPLPAAPSGTEGE